MTVSEAAAFFAGDREVLDRIEPLAAVGLDYLRLGQPVPTLSGGEAQRLKLAGHLAEAGTSSTAGHSRVPHALFLFDEPTTGLHFDDVAKLLGAFKRLLDAGHSLVVIEHNLDVIRAADWIIDLGPEGGERGGRLVAAGTPQDVMRCEASHTGRALRDYEAERAAPARERPRTGDAVAAAASGRAPRVADAARNAIVVHGAREHNLRDVDVAIPRDGMTVVTGVSGSGKSTLAFDIVFAEGQRRYLESLNAYARQFVQPAGRPDVDAIFGIPPTVAIEQRTSRGGRKSTVGTLTEVHHFLRLLYVKLGTQHCPDCDGADRAAERGRDRGAAAARGEGPAHRASSRRWSSRARATTPTSRSGPPPRATRGCAWTASTCRPRRGRGSTASASTRSSCRWASVVVGARTGARAAPAAAAGARLRQGRGARARPRQGPRVLDAPRLPVVRPQLRRARSAAVLVQLEARLVRVLLRHRCGHQGLRRRADRRGDLVERLVRGRGRALRRLRRASGSTRSR